MRAQRLVSARIGQMSVADVEVPDIAPAAGILVRARTTLISAGTEIANYLGLTLERPPGRTEPYLPGYSFSGEVLDVGSEIEGFMPGDRIAGPLPHQSYAVEDRPERLARFAVVPAGVSDLEASTSQLGCIALNGLRRAAIELGQRVVVIGAGMLGLLAAQLARTAGASTVTVLDTLAPRRHAAQALGFEAPDPAELAAVTEAYDVVVEVTGSAHAFVPALRLAAREGRVVLLGSTRAEVPGFNPYQDAHRKGLTLVGAHVSTTPTSGGAPPRWTEAANRAVFFELVRQRRLDARSLVSDVISPSGGPAAFEALAEHPERHLGVAIDWS